MLRKQLTKPAMTLFLIILLAAAASPNKNKPRAKDKGYNSLYEDLDRPSLPGILQNEVGPDITSLDYPQTSCLPWLHAEFTIEGLKSNVIALMRKGVSSSDIVRTVVDAVENYQPPLAPLAERTFPSPNFPHSLAQINRRLSAISSGRRVPGNNEELEEGASNENVHHTHQETSGNLLKNIQLPPVPRFQPRSHQPLFMPNEASFPREHTPNIKLEIQGLYPDQTYQINIDLMPFMGVNDAFQQAYMEFSYSFPTEMNPFEVKWTHSKKLGCYKVRSVGGVNAVEPFAWIIQVLNSKNKVLYEGICIPSKRDVTLRPGDAIRLLYSKDNDTNAV